MLSFISELVAFVHSLELVNNFCSRFFKPPTEKLMDEMFPDPQWHKKEGVFYSLPKFYVFIFRFFKK